MYLHWNGGRDSVEAFLEYCDLQGYRSPDNDNYGWARLCQVVGNFFGPSGLSVGIGPYTTDRWMDPGDNGIYVIEGWRISSHIKSDYYGDTFLGMKEIDDGDLLDGYDRKEFLKAIDDSMPEDQRLGELLDAEEVSRDDIEIGDVVFMRKVGGGYGKFEVVGIGVDYYGKGEAPYVDMFMNGDDAKNNPNNYVRSKTVRREKK